MSESVSDIQSHIQGKVGSQANKEYVLTFRVWSQSFLMSSTKRKTNKIKWQKKDPCKTLQYLQQLLNTFFSENLVKTQKEICDTKSQCHMKKKANIWCLHCLLFMAGCKFWLSKHTFTTNNWRKTEGNADIPALRLYGKPLKVKAFSFLCVKLSSE